MKVAGLFLYTWAGEAQATMAGMRIRRFLFYPDIPVLVMHLTGRRDRYLLLPNATGVAAPYWIEHKSDLTILPGEYIPTEKFNRLRNKYLTGMTAASDDRRLEMHIAERREEGLQGVMRLILHLMGPRPLTVLTDRAGQILETDRSTRNFRRGNQYIPPEPLDLLDPLQMTFPIFLARMAESGTGSISDFLQRHVWGIDSELASIIIPADKSKFPSTLVKQWEYFANLKARIREFVNPHTKLIIDPTRERIVDLGRGNDSVTVNELLLRRVTANLQKTETVDQQTKWQRFIKRQRKKTRKALDALSEREKHAAKAGQYRVFAETLSIHRGRIRKGQEEVALPDPYREDQTVSIPLDPKASVQQNIERYFKKHRRALAAREALQQERKRLQTITDTLDEIAGYWQQQDDPHTGVDGVQEQTWKQRLKKLRLPIPESGAPSQPRAQTVRKPYREYRLGEHYVVRVGRSARDNDELTLHHSVKTDLFFHARQVKGAHVLLRSDQPGQKPSGEILRQAAQIAAFFSDARSSGAVDVAYTEMRYVRKPRNAPPGLVNLLRENTLMVEPAPPPGYQERRDSS